MTVCAEGARRGPCTSGVGDCRATSVTATDHDVARCCCSDWRKGCAGGGTRGEASYRARRHRSRVLGPQPRTQLPGDCRVPAAVAVRPRRRTGPPGARAVLHRPGHRPRSTRCSPTRRCDAVAIATPAATHLAGGAGRAARRASTCWSRSRSPRPTRRAGELVEAAERARPRPDVRPHLLLHARRSPASARPDPRRRAGRRCSTSTRCGSTSAWCSATSTCCGTSPRTTCRSSTSSCPTDVHAGRGRARTASDPIGAGRACVALPHAAAEHRRDRPRPRQLAVPDEDPHHRSIGGSKRTAGLGRPQPDRSGCRSSTAASTWPTPASSGRDAARATCSSPTARATWSRRRWPSRRRCARHGRGVRRLDHASGRAPLTDGRSGLRVLDILEAASRSLAAGRRMHARPDRPHAIAPRRSRL